ncbi:MAG: hypothetical protein FWD61_01585 [Phycisphaerales bacterium]|nr:hypothetical protein [Phycisphaerales bacterium]
MTASDWIALATLIAGVIGGVFVWWQWRIGNKTKRAEFISQIIEKLRFDPEIPKIMYLLDYDQQWYDANFHGGSKIEEKIDKLFSYLTYICYMRKHKNISNREFCILDYEIRRVCQNKQGQAYLWNLYHFSRKMETQCSFHDLIEYLRNKVLSAEQKERFDSKDNGDYPKFLNF